MKKIFILFLMIISCLIYADETTDIKKEVEQEQKKDFIMFRGNVMLNFR